MRLNQPLISSVILFILLGFIACDNKENDNEKQYATLDFGELKDLDNIYVKQLNVQLQYSDYHTLDLSKNKEVKLPLTPEKDADFYFLQFPAAIKVLILSPGEKVKLYYDSTYYNPQDSRRSLIMSSGSEETSRLEGFTKILYALQDGMKKEFNALQDTYGADKKQMNEKLAEANKKMQETATNKLLSLIKQNMQSYANIYAAQMIDPSTNEDIIKEIYDIFKDKSLISGVLKPTIDRFSINRIGTEAILFSLPDTKKKMVTLESLRGNYVMIDFWASWCRPCRDENPNIKKAYDKYKHKGFKILGVSTDRTSKPWFKAIKDDGLNWLQVIDSIGTVASAKYKVDYIPQSLLLDPDGKIVGKNLRGEKLHTKLKEIYGI